MSESTQIQSSPDLEPTYSLFGDFKSCLYWGSDVEAGLALARQALEAKQVGSIVLFDDRTGLMTDVDPRESAQDLLARVNSKPSLEQQHPGPGRPRLGVVSREVSLLPRHWEWLNDQPGGASGALRRLIDEARRRNGPLEAARQARDSVNRVMRQLADGEGNYEEASRALFSARFEDFEALIASWRPDVRTYLARLVQEASRLDQIARRFDG